MSGKPAKTKAASLFDDELFQDELSSSSSKDVEEEVKEPPTTKKEERLATLFGEDLSPAASKPVSEHTVENPTPSPHKDEDVFADPLGVVTEVEKESQEREREKGAKSGKTKVSLFEDDDEPLFDEEKKTESPSIKSTTPTDDIQSSPGTSTKSEKASANVKSDQKAKEPSTAKEDEDDVPGWKKRLEERRKKRQASEEKEMTKEEPKSIPVSKKRVDSNKPKVQVAEDSPPQWKKRLEERRKERDRLLAGTSDIKASSEPAKPVSPVNKKAPIEKEEDEGDVPAWKRRLEERRRERERLLSGEVSPSVPKSPTSPTPKNSSSPTSKRPTSPDSKRSISPAPKDSSSPTPKGSTSPLLRSPTQDKPPSAGRNKSRPMSELITSPRMLTTPNSPETRGRSRSLLEEEEEEEGETKKQAQLPSSLPKWKQDLLARRRSPTVATATPSTSAVKKEPEVPAWKKELMKKRKQQSTEVS